ncbi:MAG: hypothetical protein PHE02_11600 [Lachnospiraceae bacterium]|nr:hypothetical protein [Lachnospiraceae bacterium]
MDWNSIWDDVISGCILLAIGGVGGWFAGLFKGKKESSAEVERKDELYQPLLDNLVKYTDFDWSIMEKVNGKVLQEIVNNSYKYGLDDELQKKCQCLDQLVREYNSIDPIRVADNVIVEIFTKGYEDIYGTIIDGICHHADRDGNEWDEEILV